MPALLAENVTAGYGRTPIITDISLSVEKGTVTTIIGPNGAGKSTFAKAVVGILRPTNGRIVVGDLDITRMPGHQIPRHGVAYVPQNDNVFKSLTVRENLEVGGFAVKGDTSARMEEILSVFTDLDKAREKKAGFLSGGSAEPAGNRASLDGWSVGHRSRRTHRRTVARVYRRRLESGRADRRVRNGRPGRRAER